MLSTHLPPLVSALQSVDASRNGSCSAGSIYKITNYEDLLSQSDNLMCIFAAGITPDKVPTGFLYGRMVSFANTAAFNSLINTHYQGDFVYEALCQQQTLYLGEVRIDGVTAGVGELKVAAYKDAFELISDEEFFDKRENDQDGLIYEFDQNLYARCKPDKQKADRTNKPLLFFGTNAAGLTTNTYPTNIFTDVLRVVGRSNDGALLLLGRTFVKNPAVVDSKPTTAYFFMLKSFDATVNSLIEVNQSLPVLSQSFSYRLHGLPTLLVKANPVKFLLSLWTTNRLTAKVSSIIVAMLENSMKPAAL